MTGADRVVRDRMTITLYGSYAVWGWFLYSFNPSVPLLAADQGISAALAGLHGTAMAAGGLGAAFLAPRAVLAWGRRRAIVASCGAVVVGVTGLVAGPSLPWTLSAMVVLAAGGNVLISSAQVGLALHHGRRASAVITEGNGTGSGIGLLGPLAVGATLSLGWGWRPAVLVTAPLAIVVAVLVGRLPATSILTGRRAAPDAGTALDAGPAPDAGAAPVPDPAPAPVPRARRRRTGRGPSRPPGTHPSG